MKEEDIRPTELFSKYLAMSAADAEKYFSKSTRKVIPCPACGGKSVFNEFEKFGFNYVSCCDCTTLFQSPRPDQESFEHFYTNSPSAKFWADTFFPSVAEARRQHLFKPKVRKIVQLCEKNNFHPSVVADVGAGFGIFLEEWKVANPKSRTIAIEPNPILASACREKKIEVQQCFAEKAEHLFGSMDLVVSLEVLEHVYDPLKFCRMVRKLIRPGGKVLLTTLTVSGFDVQVLWEKSNSIFPPHHINFISIQGAHELMKRAGFSGIDIFTPGKLDVDIVKNALKETIPSRRTGFIHTLLNKNEKTLNDFQEFLSLHQLSSHCWIWATS